MDKMQMDPLRAWSDLQVRTRSAVVPATEEGTHALAPTRDDY